MFEIQDCLASVGPERQASVLIGGTAKLLCVFYLCNILDYKKENITSMAAQALHMERMTMIMTRQQ